MTRSAPTWVRVVTVAAVSVVAAVAAVISFNHIHELADRAGEQWRAVLIPLSVDGLLVAASMTMFVRRREGRTAGPLPWLGVVLGIAASLAANVAAGWDDWNPPWLAGVIAAWPPIALAIAFELLIGVARESTTTTLTTDEGAARSDDVETIEPPAEDDDSPAGEDRASELIAAGVGRRRLAKELQISEHEARALLATSRNGDGQ